MSERLLCRERTSFNIPHYKGNSWKETCTKRVTLHNIESDPDHVQKSHAKNKVITFAASVQDAIPNNGVFGTWEILSWKYRLPRHMAKYREGCHVRIETTWEKHTFLTTKATPDNAESDAYHVQKGPANKNAIPSTRYSINQHVWTCVGPVNWGKLPTLI